MPPQPKTTPSKRQQSNNTIDVINDNDDDGGYNSPHKMSDDDFDDDDDGNNLQNDLAYDEDDEDGEDDDDLFDSTSEQLSSTTLTNNIDSTTIINTPSSPTQHSSNTKTLLAKLGLINTSDNTLLLETRAEREVYNIFNTNEPFSKTQIIDHPQLKSSGLKKKDIEDGLVALIQKDIVKEQNLTGTKTIIYYLNQQHRPKLSNPNDLKMLEEEIAKLETKFQFNRILLLKLDSDIVTMRKSIKTDELEQQVQQLRDEYKKRQDRLALLQSVSSDPQYIQSLKKTYTSTLHEWKRRRKVIGDMAEPYLQTVQKKQRVFFRELDCGDEEVELGMTLEQCIEYGKKSHIFDAQGRVLQPGGMNYLNANPSTQNQLQSPLETLPVTKKSGLDKPIAYELKPGESVANKLMSRLGKPQSPPKVSTTQLPPPPLKVNIKPLVFKSLPTVTTKPDPQPNKKRK